MQYSGDVARDARHSDLWRHVIYRAVVGSRAYGLEDDQSDTDYRGIYLPPAERHWSLAGVPEQLENEATQEVYWELEKFLRLALKANPNVLESLWSPLVEQATPLAIELRERRRIFLSKQAYQTFNGYAISQFRKLQADLRNKGMAKPKHAMHLIRLLLTGIETLRTGEVPVPVAEEYRNRLLTIKRGKFNWNEVDRWRLSLHEQLDAALATSPLPDRPDFVAADAFLLRARRSALDLT